jgi:hypothetical protein
MKVYSENGTIVTEYSKTHMGFEIDKSQYPIGITFFKIGQRIKHPTLFRISSKLRAFFDKYFQLWRLSKRRRELWRRWQEDEKKRPQN